MKKTIIISFVLLFVIQGYSQSNVKYFSKSYSKNITITQNSDITNYIETCVGLNKRQNGFMGYRIKIYSQNNALARNQANTIAANFREQFPEQKAYVEYVEPNFEVHVGNFIDRLEAVAFLNENNKKYPAAFIIKTIITYPNRGEE
ncbi:MAG: hypothetical protein LBV69_10625 [Bacteroidales bacterium]|jgi:hypothetical protein|nr:hypothetical protein [Bacteroidales bacterium]